MSKVSKEEIDAFLSGTDPMERIIKIECGYDEDKVSIIYRDEKGNKRIRRENFFPFVWTKQSVARQLYDGDRAKIKEKMSYYGIGVKPLRVNRDDGTVPERMERGYRLLFYAKMPMTYNKFMEFFKYSGHPIYPNERDATHDLKEFIAVAPIEQYMIQTGRRLFKGYDDYDDLLRMQWDLETEGLDPNKDAISQIGVRTNKGFEEIITIEGEGEEKLKNELKAIMRFFEIIKELQPDILSGHNTENFDWYFIDVRLSLRGIVMGDFSTQYFKRGVYKKNKQQVLKLGGEMEYFKPTVMWGTNLTDSLFAVRRSMAVNSNIKSANLKYITKFSKINKPNRVYVPGKIINDTWEDLSETYAFNDENGEWFKVDNKRMSKTLEDGSPKYTDYNEGDKHLLKDNSNDTVYEFVTGRYIVQRYLLDDLWETDKVEYKFNVTNFFVCKLLPVSFEKACTMGTAAVWKYIMLAWSYEHGLAIPELVSTRKFTGGLSRLLKTGYIKPQIKADFSSLYPSLILSFGIKTEIDLMDIMMSLLEYLLTQRETYKVLKNESKGKSEKLADEIHHNSYNKEKVEKLLKEKEKADADFVFYDNIQACVKLICNGFFGSYGSGNPFPHSDMECAEQTTCSGRQALRLMIGHFTNLGTKNDLGKEYNYCPVVGDSFTPDTPLYIKYKDSGLVDIKPISELIDEKSIEIDVLGREYDYSPKNYYVLCRSGWVEPSYIYRHKTNKPIYRVSEPSRDMTVEVTEDHSLFTAEKKKIKPSELTKNTKLEYYEGDITSNVKLLDEKRIIDYSKLLINGKLKAIPVDLLNATRECKLSFLSKIEEGFRGQSKTLNAGLQYIKKCVF